MAYDKGATLESFIDYGPDCDFPIQNLPYGIFHRGADPRPLAGVAIGRQVLDLAALSRSGLLVDVDIRVWESGSLNSFMRLGRPIWRRVRERLTQLLDAENSTLRDDAGLRSLCFVPMDQVTMRLPVEIGGYTDFYSSLEHAENCGKLFRPENPLFPNWRHLPVAYNGRPSSIVVSGTPVRRPLGQIKPAGAASPMLGPSAKIDYELEVAFIVGKDSELGSPIGVGDAMDHVFGLVLMNDWSARDIQVWEYVPLGPFNGKSFGTTISPWVVTLEALQPFQVPSPTQDPAPMDYLTQGQGGGTTFDIELEVTVAGAGERVVTCRSNFKYLYWTMAQQIAHHTIGGCNLRVGDLVGSGTISGQTQDACGSLLEYTRNGTTPFAMGDQDSRAFLEDDDEVIMRGWAQQHDWRVGFGSAQGVITPAHSLR